MSVRSETDAELVRRWANGDRKAGGAFARRHFVTLWTYFHSKVPETPDDLIQRTLLQCQRFVVNLAQAASVRAYLLSIARSELRSYYRARRPTEDFEDLSVRDTAASTLGTKLARKRVQHQVSAALQGLSLAHQEVLELHYWSDLPVSEIAQVLDVPVGTVKSRLIRARKALDERLVPGEDVDLSLRRTRPANRS